MNRILSKLSFSSAIAGLTLLLASSTPVHAISGGGTMGCFNPTEVADLLISDSVEFQDDILNNDDPKVCVKQCKKLAQGCDKIVKNAAKCLSDAIKTLTKIQILNCKLFEDKAECIDDLKTQTAAFLAESLAPNTDQAKAACAAEFTLACPDSCFE